MTWMAIFVFFPVLIKKKFGRKQKILHRDKFEIQRLNEPDCPLEDRIGPQICYLVLVLFVNLTLDTVCT